MTTIELNKKEFIKTLNVGGTFAGRNKTIPILDCVNVKISKGFLTVISNDGENAISKKMQIDNNEQEIIFCVNHKDLLSYVKLVNGDNITLLLGDKDVEVKHEKGNMTIPSLGTEEFPNISCDENVKNLTVQSYLINNWIVDARNFVSNDDLKPSMGTIYFYSKDNEFGCCATDGLFMFTDNIKSESFEDFDFMLNKGAFKAVCDVCQENDEIHIKLGDKNVMFVGNGISVLARLQSSKYPNFKAVMPNNNNIKVRVNKQELIDSINRVKCGASSVTCLVKIEVNGMNMQVSAQDLDFNRKTVENMFVEADGSITIGFNANKMQTALGSINSEYVILEMSSASRPCIMSEDDEKSNKIVLLMPMLLND